MTNKPIRWIAAALFLLSINNVHAQTINPNIVNDWPNNRYTVHDNGTVTDTVTGLMWMQCSVGQSGSSCGAGTATVHNWQQALQLAGTANTDRTSGYSNWRLPNVKELGSLAALDRYEPAINSHVFPNSSYNYYWSSSPYAVSSNSAWLVYFYYGGVYDGNRNSNNRVRLVRSGQ